MVYFFLLSFQTYCVDSRVPDSACASTAFLTGVKSNLGTVAVHPTVKRGDCVATNDKVKQLESIAKWALDAGRVVGECCIHILQKESAKGYA